MAEEETGSRIEELKARLEADPGSRVFYQLGEELRKTGHAEEAETVLRTGLEKHPAYLSAWISLGRVLKETERSEEAIEVLNRAFELDRQNVVVARLLGDAYAQTGEHVEAIKKYKLVAALHPADEEVQEKIEHLEKILEQEGKLESPSGAPVPPPPPQSDQDLDAAPSEEGTEDGTMVDPGSEDEQPGEPEPGADSAAGASADEPFGLDDAGTDVISTPDEAETASVEEPEWSQPVDREATTGGEPAATVFGETPAEPSSQPEEEAATDDDDVVATVTMGDLYARQGHVEQAREIYRKVLSRDPGHPEAAERLSSIDQSEPSHTDEGGSSSDSATERDRIRRLETWLSKVNRS